MGTAQAPLMDSSLSRQIISSLSIFPDQPLHRLAVSMTRGLSVVVTSMLPALPTDSWLASKAHRLHKQRGSKRGRSIHGRWSLHATRRARRGEIQSRRAELSIEALCGRPFVTRGPG